ncbi:MAG: thiol:disulfide interchange protein DsbC [Steroidobacteraceae bacterium]|nr:thiol:disulfide interchange protein DsbC [Steroidobacteraceae bacterium]
MNRQIPILPSLVAFALLLAAPSAMTETAPKADVRAEIARRLDVKPEEIQPSPIPGLYEVRSGSDVGYVSVDGRFYVNGDIFDMKTRDNLTETARQQGRIDLLAKVTDADAIVFTPQGSVRHTLTVFTDIDCPYCRRMHQEIAELNRLGIRVRYLMFPRSGPDTDSWHKAEAVWCSADRRDALTRAKRGEVVKAPKCKSSIAEQYALGHEMGIRGTPAIITDKGEYVDHYMPAAQLSEYLSTPAVAVAAD